MSETDRNASSSKTRYCKSARTPRNIKIPLKRFAKSTGCIDTPLKNYFHTKSSYGVDENNVYLNLIEEVFRASKERWITLGLFCALNCTQCYVWNTWGPIGKSMILAFSTWNNSTIALLSNWGCITYLFVCFPTCWLLYKKGLPLPLQIAAVLSALATFIRCLSSEEIIFTITAHVASILNGISGAIIGPAMPLVSATWFPPWERTTATGISLASNQLGMAISYLIGPAVVGPASKDTPFLKRSIKPIHNESYTFDSLTQNLSDYDQMILRVQIMSFMRIEFVAQFLVLVGILCFLPKHRDDNTCNPTPCSARFEVAESLIRLLRDKSTWWLCLSAALSQGTTGPWLAMVPIIFNTTITQDEADQLAFWTILVSTILSLFTSRVTDMFQGQHKIAIATLLATSSLMFLWILLLDNRVLVFHKYELYAAVILGISASWSTPALFLELASEIAFPVSEAIVAGYMIFLTNLIGTLFYFSYFIPDMGMISNQSLPEDGLYAIRG